MSLELIPPSGTVDEPIKTSSELELKFYKDDIVARPGFPKTLPLPEGIEVMPKKRAIMTHTIRVLTPSEIDQLAPIFAERGVELPDPKTSFFIGAIDGNGKVTQNFLVGQMRFHAEPLHLEAGGEHLFRPLARAMYDEIVKRYGTMDVFLFAPNEHIVKMAEVMGFEKDPWVSLSTRIYGNAIVTQILDYSKFECDTCHHTQDMHRGHPNFVEDSTRSTCSCCQVYKNDQGD